MAPASNPLFESSYRTATPADDATTKAISWQVHQAVCPATVDDPLRTSSAASPVGLLADAAVSVVQPAALSVQPALPKQHASVDPPLGNLPPLQAATEKVASPTEGDSHEAIIPTTLQQTEEYLLRCKTEAVGRRSGRLSNPAVESMRSPRPPCQSSAGPSLLPDHSSAGHSSLPSWREPHQAEPDASLLLNLQVSSTSTLHPDHAANR